MVAFDETRVLRMQENLATIRKVAGWSAQRLADEIGVTRQTISNLERGKTPLTKTQYIALRYVLNQEIADSENQALAKVISALVDDPIEEPEEEGSSVMGSLSATTSLLAAGIVASAMSGTLPGGGLLAPMSIAFAMSSKAIRKALESSSKKEWEEG